MNEDDLTRARAFFEAWGLVSYPESQEETRDWWDRQSEAIQALAQVLEDERLSAIAGACGLRVRQFPLEEDTSSTVCALRHGHRGPCGAVGQ